MDFDAKGTWDALRDNPLAGPLVVDPIEGINEAGGFYQPDRPVRDWLEEGPIEGIYMSPYDPVDPRDCEKWPNSPYCNAWETVAIEDIRKPYTFDFKPTASNCEVCVELYPRVLGGALGPPTIICKRRDSPECQVPPPPPPRPPQTTGQLQDPGHVAASQPGFIRLVAAFTYVEIREGYVITQDGLETGSCNFGELSGKFDEQYPSPPHKKFIIPGTILSSGYKGGFDIPPRQERESLFAFKDYPIDPRRQPLGVANNYGRYSFLSYEKVNRGGSFQTSVEGCENSQVTAYKETQYYCQPWAVWRNYSCNSGYSLSQLKTFFQDYLLSQWGFDYFESRIAADAIAPYAGSTPFSFYTQTAGDGCDQYKPKPVPQPIPEREDPMGCCEETLELLEAIYSRLGVDEFPVKAPLLLTQESEEQADLENHAQLWEWSARNLDALMGQFPVKIKIKDSDPSTAGDQEVEVSLPNVAEALAELFGLVYQAEIGTDLNSEILLRLIPEVIATKNATITAQSYAKANASYLGYEGNTKEVYLDYNFDLENRQSLPQFLQETKKRVRVYRDESKESVADILAKLEFAAGIIKAAFYTKPSEKHRLLDAIETMINDEKLSTANKEQWRDWLQRMNRDLGKHNIGQIIQPEIREETHEGVDTWE